MITAVQSANAQPIRRTCGTPVPKDESPAIEPRDQVHEFALIDTPQEAAQLPILEPSFQFALAMGLSAALNPDLGVSVYLTANTVSGEVAFDQGTGLHVPDENGYIGSGGGYVGKNYFEGNSLQLTEDGQGFVFNQRFGDTDTHLTFAPAEHGTSIRGTIGQVETDLTMQIFMDEQGMHIQTDGTLGGQAYNVRADSQEEGGWVAQGNLDSAAISKRYASRQEVDEDGTNRVYFEGSGQNAGMDQTVALEMRISKN